MKIIFDSPQPIEKLRKIYNDRVKFITNTSIWPMVEAIELNGDYLSGMRKREVPVKVGKKVDKLIDKYASRLKAVWAAYQKELTSVLHLDVLKSYSVTEDLTKDQDAPTLAQVESEEDPSRRQVLMVQYLKARKDRLIKPKLEDMKQDLKRAALPMFSAVYVLGKQRGQILTSQQIDDDLTPEDQKNLEEKEDWNDEFIDNLVDDAYAKYSDALEGDYENEDELYAAFQDAHKKEEHRLPLFAAALGSVLLGAGMAQAMKDVQEIDPETGEPTGEPKTDENGLPLGEVILGGYWHTSHDDRVCDGCENNDGFWMTVDEYQAEVGTNDCITNCRCPELFEPAERSEDEGQIWQGTPGMDKSVHAGNLSKEWREEMHPRDGDGKFSESGGEKPDIGADKPETHVPEKLTNVEGLKQWLGSGTKLIMSAERSQKRPEENYRRSVGLKRILENHADEIVMQTGHYGGKERSYLAAPNSNEDANSLVQMALSPREGEQEAVIVIRDGVAEMKYADNRPSEYAKVSEMKEAPEATDFYSEIGGVKYQLDFRYKEKPNG